MMTMGKKKKQNLKKIKLANFSQKKTAIAKKKKRKEKRAQIIPPHPHPTLPARNQKSKIEKRKSVASPQKLRKKDVFGR
jgi:hypothetical protein